MNLNLANSLPPVTSCLYQSEADLRDMYTLLMQARASSDDWRYPHVGDLAFWYFMVDCHLDPRQYIRLWHAADGRLAAYAILGEDPTFDCQVLPEYAWSGIEAQALAWAEAFLAELRQQDMQLWGGGIISGARQDDTCRIAFLEGHGFHPGGEFSEVNMIRSLDESIPESAVPPGCQVRAVADALSPGGSAEISDRAAAQREVWHPWTVGNVSDDDYARFMRQPGYHRDLDVIAIAPDGVIAAYVNGWIDPLNHIGDFGPVGARQTYRRQGLTRLVLVECMRRMQDYGMDRVSVSTGEHNTPAIRLYESVGFKVVNRYIEFIKTG